MCSCTVNSNALHTPIRTSAWLLWNARDHMAAGQSYHKSISNITTSFVYLQPLRGDSNHYSDLHLLDEIGNQVHAKFYQQATVSSDNTHT